MKNLTKNTASSHLKSTCNNMIVKPWHFLEHPVRCEYSTAPTALGSNYSGLTDERLSMYATGLKAHSHKGISGQKKNKTLKKTRFTKLSQKLLLSKDKSMDSSDECIENKSTRKGNSLNGCAKQNTSCISSTVTTRKSLRRPRANDDLLTMVQMFGGEVDEEPETDFGDTLSLEDKLLQLNREEADVCPAAIRRVCVAPGNSRQTHDDPETQLKASLHVGLVVKESKGASQLLHKLSLFNLKSANTEDPQIYAHRLGDSLQNIHKTMLTPANTSSIIEQKHNELIKTKEPCVHTHGVNCSEKMLKFMIPQHLIHKVHDYRVTFVESLVARHAYASLGCRNPWQIVSRVSDGIILDLLSVISGSMEKCGQYSQCTREI